MHKTATIATSVAFTFLIFSLSFFLTLFDRDLYDKSFVENGVYDELGVEGVRSTVDNLIRFLTREGVGRDTLTLFFRNEQDHLEDVKRLVLAAKYLTVLAAILLSVLIYWSRDRILLLKKSLLYSSAAALALLIAIGLLSINFSLFWEGFHKVLFPQGNYTFPPDHLLIKLFPEEFFAAFTRRMLLHIGVLCLAMLGTSFALPKDNARSNDVRQA